jgi:2-polyprenyl-6-hydroxyphenyl methylase/3-demethylubiquinone-9 3-methyltransferase
METNEYLPLIKTDRLWGGDDRNSVLPLEQQPEEAPKCEPLPQPRGYLEAALRRFVSANWKVSARLHKVAARLGQTGGPEEYAARLTKLLRPGLTVIDLGGGKHPSISVARKRRLGLHVIGVDIMQAELDAAPAGAYDEAICQSAETFVRPGSADLIISQALAEHLPNPLAMFRCAYASLRPGGETLHFIPNRLAFFAWLNRHIPHKLKQKLLYTFYPMSRMTLGFYAYYRDCVPSRIHDCFRSLGFRHITITAHYRSSYSVAFFPAHAAMVGYQLAAQGLGAVDLCENFVVHARK